MTDILLQKMDLEALETMEVGLEDKLHISKKQDTYIQAAKQVALKSTFTFRIGCVAVSEGKIIAEGYNHERSALKGRTLTSFHAEVNTLSKILRCRKDRLCEQRAQGR